MSVVLINNREHLEGTHEAVTAAWCCNGSACLVESIQPRGRKPKASLLFAYLQKPDNLNSRDREKAYSWLRYLAVVDESGAPCACALNPNYEQEISISGILHRYALIASGRQTKATCCRRTLSDDGYDLTEVPIPEVGMLQKIGVIVVTEDGRCFPTGIPEINPQFALLGYDDWIW